MGVKQFFNLFDKSIVNEIKIKELNGKTIAIDCMTEIYRCSLGFKGQSSQSLLTDSNGKSTMHINTIFMTALKFKKAGVTQIYVFDSTVHVKEKEAELKKRSDYREKHNLFSVTSEMIKDIQKLLTLLGISWVITPDGYDAEHLCAKLNISANVDHVLTTDADAFLYGALSILKYEKRKLMNYTVDMFEDSTNIDCNKIPLIGVIMGTDFCEKTSNIGPKTVIKKYNDISLSDCQKEALKVFNRDIKLPTIKCYDSDYKSLTIWLSTLNFNRERLSKLLLIPE